MEINCTIDMIFKKGNSNSNSKCQRNAQLNTKIYMEDHSKLNFITIFKIINEDLAGGSSLSSTTCVS